jgi:endo-1,3(4)-beta-glucanase
MTWILFSSELIELSFDAETRTEIVASKKFSGVLRLALIPPTAEFLNGNFTGLLPLSVSTGLKRLVYHAGLYPVGGSVSWEFKSSPTQSAVAAENAIKAIVGGTTVKPTPSSTRAKLATVQFKYQTLPLNQNSNSKLQLLMLGLPHHEDVLQPEVLLGQDEFDLSYKSIKGKMTPVVGSTWSYDEKLTMSTIDHTSDLRFDRNVADLILQNVQNDAAMLVPQDNLNVYGYGKQLARLAQLAHITNVILNEPTNSTSRLLHEITTNLQQSLVKLFEGDVVDQLLYDAKFGGIVSKNGIADASEDFGNGRFNDHHFHYG